MSDNATQCSSSDFKSFEEQYLPNANGEPQRVMQMARMILKQDDPLAGPDGYTVIAATGCSHAQLMMAVTSVRPCQPCLLHSCLLPQLSHRDTVRIGTGKEKSWTNTGVIINRVDTPRSYTVQIESNVYRRNRLHLRFMPLSPKELSRVPIKQPQMTVVPTRMQLAKCNWSSLSLSR